MGIHTSIAGYSPSSCCMHVCRIKSQMSCTVVTSSQAIGPIMNSVENTTIYAKCLPAVADVHSSPYLIFLPTFATPPGQNSCLLVQRSL